MSTFSRRLAAAVLSVTAGLAAVGAVPQNAAAADDPGSGIATRTVVTSTRFHPYYGQRFVLKGQVQLVSADESGKATYTPFPKQEVQLFVCTAACFGSSPSWRYLKTTTSSDDESAVFRFPMTARKTHVYRVLFPADKYLGIITTSAAAILVRTHRHVTVRLRQPRPAHFTMSGRVYPFYGHQRAYLMRKSCASCTFRTVKSQVTRAHGGYRFRFGSPRRTSFYVVRARTSHGLSTSYSKVAKILVRH